MNKSNVESRKSKRSSRRLEGFYFRLGLRPRPAALHRVGRSPARTCAGTFFEFPAHPSSVILRGAAVIYRENGQFKATYSADLQMLPILQDRIFMIALVACAFLIMPFMASDYLFLSIVIPFLILTLAAIGLNLLVGYCGQISLGHAAFMAVGAYAAYNIMLRIPQLNFLVVLVLAGLIAAAVGMLFGIPSLRIKGLYLAVATLAAQFFMDWVFARVKWFTDYAGSGSVSTAAIELFGWKIDTPAEKYLFLLAV